MTILLLSFLIPTFKSSDPFLVGNILTRYFIGFPGIFLTAYALFLHLDYFKKIKLMSVKNALKLLIISFLFYAFFSGAIVPKAGFFPASILNYNMFRENIGIPVQVFRTICALVAAYSMIMMLRVFRYETETKLMKLSRAIENSGDSVIITDKNGIIEYVNPAFVR